VAANGKTVSAPRVILCSVCVFLGACASTEAFMQVVAESGANQGTATPLDLVWVFDEPSLALMPEASRGWFEQKAALRASMGKRIAVVSLAVAPGSVIDRVEYPAAYEHAAALLVYADYLDGEPVLKLGRHRACLLLKATNVIVNSC